MKVLRRVDPAMRIVVMSGAPGEEWTTQAEELGMAVCLTKPFALSELEATIQSSIAELD